MVRSSLKAPAWLLVVPVLNSGVKLRGLGAHGLPLGPAMMLNVEDGVAGALPDHGAIDAVVV